MTNAKTGEREPSSDAEALPRPGPRDTRGVLADRILAAARSLFATSGYGSTSLRRVADEAGVDVALVSYYFKNKAGLLDAALTLPGEFAARVAEAANAPIEQRGQVIVSTHLAAWEDRATADILCSTIRAAANEPSAMERVRTIYTSRFLDVVANGLPDTERHLRSGLIASQMIGLAMVRYVWRVGALADLSPETVNMLVSPVIQGYLTGPLPEDSTTRLRDSLGGE
jgi:AcrR family transcriptional regulator